MKPFIPDNLPLANINWTAHVNSIGKAQAALARYDGMLQSIVNPGLLLAPLTTQEAVLSSRIEGTLATMEEVFEFDADPNEKLSPGKQADIQEIINYRRAISYSVAMLEKRPLTLNVIKELHAMLLDSVRGRNKAPGEFRRIQNYIGSPGADIAEASYVPPSPEMVMPALDIWEKYIHSNEMDALVQLAIPAITHSQYSVLATDALFVSPIITTSSFIRRSSIPKDSAVRILNALRAARVLHDVRIPKGRRSGLFSFSELWGIVH